MEVITYYFIFALATALTILVRFYIPVLKIARNDEIKNAVTIHPILGCVVFVVITTFLAPVLLSTLIVSEHGKHFMQGLHRSMIAKDD